MILTFSGLHFLFYMTPLNYQQGLVQPPVEQKQSKRITVCSSIEHEVLSKKLFWQAQTNLRTLKIRLTHLLHPKFRFMDSFLKYQVWCMTLKQSSMGGLVFLFSPLQNSLRALEGKLKKLSIVFIFPFRVFRQTDLSHFPVDVQIQLSLQGFLMTTV